MHVHVCTCIHVCSFEYAGLANYFSVCLPVCMCACVCLQVLHNASQEEVYEECARGVVSPLLDGYNGTIMAYGETGAGKTYTMTGGTQTYRLRGVIPRAIAQVRGSTGFTKMFERPGAYSTYSSKKLISCCLANGEAPITHTSVLVCLIDGRDHVGVTLA